MIRSTVPTIPRSAPAVGAAAAVRVDAARRRPAIGPDADLIVFARGALPTATASSVEVPAEIAICDDNRNGRTSGAELRSDTSPPSERPGPAGQIAMKVINHFRDAVMKVLQV